MKKRIGRGIVVIYGGTESRMMDIGSQNVDVMSDRTRLGYAWNRYSRPSTGIGSRGNVDKGRKPAIVDYKLVHVDGTHFLVESVEMTLHDKQQDAR